MKPHSISTLSARPRAAQDFIDQRQALDEIDLASARARAESPFHLLEAVLASVPSAMVCFDFRHGYFGCYLAFPHPDSNSEPLFLKSHEVLASREKKRFASLQFDWSDDEEAAAFESLNEHAVARALREFAPAAYALLAPLETLHNEGGFDVAPHRQRAARG